MDFTSELDSSQENIQGNSMINNFKDVYTLLNGGFFIVCGIAFFIFAFRTRFWLPKYVHIMAILSLFLGLALMYMLPEDAPIRREWREYALIFTLFLPPTIVYFVFISFGGQHTSYNDRNIEETYVCPFCDQHNHKSNTCSNCGRYF